MKILLPTILILSFLRLHFVVSTFHNNNTFLGASLTTRLDEQPDKYKQSVHKLLRTLEYQFNSGNTTGFFNSFEYPNQQLYGVYMCRGDLDPQACRECVNLAKKEILKSQLYGRKANIWYDHCMMRYSDKPFFGTLDEIVSTSVSDKDKISTDKIRFVAKLTRALNDLAVKAALSDKYGKQKRFSTKIVRLTRVQSLYALAQCTTDLSSSDCYKCLMKAADQLKRMQDSLSGKVMRLNCMVRYETFPFFDDQQIKSLQSSS